MRCRPARDLSRRIPPRPRPSVLIKRSAWSPCVHSRLFPLKPRLKVLMQPHLAKGSTQTMKPLLFSSECTLGGAPHLGGFQKVLQVINLPFEVLQFGDFPLVAGVGPGKGMVGVWRPKCKAADANLQAPRLSKPTWNDRRPALPGAVLPRDPKQAPPPLSLLPAGPVSTAGDGAPAGP